MGNNNDTLRSEIEALTEKIRQDIKALGEKYDKQMVLVVKVKGSEGKDVERLCLPENMSIWFAPIAVKISS